MNNNESKNEDEFVVYVFLYLERENEVSIRFLCSFHKTSIVCKCISTEIEIGLVQPTSNTKMDSKWLWFLYSNVYIL